MCYNQTKIVKNELYMEHFHGHGIKKPRIPIRRYFKNNPTKDKFGARWWHKETFLKIWAQSDQKSIFFKSTFGKKNSECPVQAHLTNFSFEFFYAIFTEDAPLFRLHHGANK